MFCLYFQSFLVSFPDMDFKDEKCRKLLRKFLNKWFNGENEEKQVHNAINRYFIYMKIWIS